MCLWAFFSPPLTLSKCNSCLTSTCFVFKKCPRHWCQASCQAIPHQGLLCHRTGSCEVSSIVGRHNHSDSQSSGLGLFEMHALCILPGALLFKPHNVCDGMFRKSFYLFFFFLPQMRQLLPPVTRNDVDVDGFSDFKVVEQREKWMLNNGHCCCRRHWGKMKKKHAHCNELNSSYKHL